MGLDPSSDLSAEVVAAALPERAIRCYPALLSTQAEALAWARAGAPAGAVVVADYQASPRGRAGWPWEMDAGEGLGFSLVMRPDDLPPAKEGWLFTVGVSGIADVVGEPARIRWPDAVLVEGDEVAAIGVDTELGGLGQPGGAGALGGGWGVVTVRVDDAPEPRADRLAAVVMAMERRLAQDADEVLDAYRRRCETLGRRVRARLLPMGPDGPEVVGEAVDVLVDGALSILADTGRRIAVRPHHLGLLEDAQRTEDARAQDPGLPR